ncbi:carboxypeptidase-like regulatory domain-containing protein [Planctomyces sp. SH-PL14]|uniref:carboxypeptidase-like regulatory domain-containing protein n=1 Tax=Planctomyces sp. SH-PL14 TaxID=1632864 RepID=UPI00078C94D1|nr:carboxypeptidase-like regulatory domain-containing protein [Planctomyces sp. SH-PL14]AMV21091.1 hypothetical protein VT03_24520 [Planctomyces sp. SH-PL14]
MRTSGSNWRHVCVLNWARQALLLAAIVLGITSPASALILGGEGNDPINDPGWPAGAAAVFNTESRIAYWEGPPFGGGQYHAECRGNAAVFNLVLEDFAKIEAKTKRLVVHDGEGASFWLNTNSAPEKKAAAVTDWTFIVWVPANWQRQRKLPVGFRPPDVLPDREEPPVQIDVYTGGRIIWSDVVVPEGIEVVDERLEAHGFKPSDGTVLEGIVTAADGGKPVAATISIEEMESNPKGGYLYTEKTKATTDATGRWVVKNCPPGRIRLVARADGHAPRVLGHRQVTDEPRWASLPTSLAKSATITGQVVDGDGKPLEGVKVRLDQVSAGDGMQYEIPDDREFVTAADGRFKAEALPRGTAALWTWKEGYCKLGLAQPMKTPAEDVVLKMFPAAEVTITVPEDLLPTSGGYIVNMVPKGGEAVGKWSGSGNIDGDRKMVFRNVPPGEYRITGRPNPGSANDETPPVAVDLKGGEKTEVTLKPKS